MTPRPRTRAALTALALPLLLAGLTACSSGGSDTADGDGPEAQARAWDAAYVACVEDAGFETEGPFAGMSTSADPAELDAVDACFQETTADLGDRPVTEAEEREGEEDLEEYDRVIECFREKGVDVGETQEGVQAPPQDVPDDIVAACDAEGIYGAGAAR